MFLIKKNKHQKGFTLIELLVVIAIIGVLAGVLFVSIDPSAQINKSEDVSIKSSVATIPAAAQLVYDLNDFNYSTVCDASNPSIYRIASRSGTVCAAESDAYAVEALLNDGNYYCVDSIGHRGVTLPTDTRVKATATKVTVCGS